MFYPRHRQSRHSCANNYGEESIATGKLPAMANIIGAMGWVYCARADNYWTITGKRDGTAGFGLQQLPNGVSGPVYYVSGRSNGSNFDLVPTHLAAPNFQAWNHVAFNINSGVVNLFINGMRVMRSTYSHSTLNNTEKLHFGNQFLPGRANEFYYFDRELSLQEIRDHIRTGDINLKGLIASNAFAVTKLLNASDIIQLMLNTPNTFTDSNASGSQNQWALGGIW